MHRLFSLSPLLVLSLAGAIAAGGCTQAQQHLFAADAQAAAPAPAAAQPAAAQLPVAAPVLAQASPGGSGGDAQLAPMPSLAPLVKRLRPVVVNINSKYRPRAQAQAQRNQRKGVMPPGHPQVDPRDDGEGGDDESGDPMERFFRRFGNPNGGMPDRRERSGLGSGFLIGDGLVITNNHVVQIQEGPDGKFRPMDEIKVITDDLAQGGTREFAAKLIGADPKSDIALLRIDDPKGKALPGANLGDSDALEVGDYVVAIGEPFGLQATVTAGIVSAKERVQAGAGQNGAYTDYLQTDASINPGNSGGPLFNLRGEVVGVNSAIISGANTIGFAIPIAVVKQILPQLKKDGKVVRGFLGVQLQPLNQDTAEQLGLKSTQGALVADVVKGGPAAEAGLKAGDVITAVNGKAIADNFMLTREVGTIPPGQSIKLDYIRETRAGSLTAKVKARPEDEENTAPPSSEGEKGGADLLGLVIEPLTPDLARRARVDVATKGVIITDLSPESVAASAGIEPGMVIVEVNRKAVSTPEEYSKAVKNVKPGDVVLLRVRTANAAQFITLRIPK
jgi:serine protease Do